MWLVASAALALLAACTVDPVSPPTTDLHLVQNGRAYTAVADGQELFSLDVAKWAGGRSAAVSITYDAPWGTHEDHHLATDAAIARGLCMDIEMVTWIFTQPRWEHLPAVYREELLPRGVRFFGHGHTHALHDTMDYAAAYESFHTCFELMDAWGMSPLAYAYPGSSGLLPSTQQANRDVGFICARGSTAEPETWQILAGDDPEPPNWYYLPAVPMGNGSYRHLQEHAQLAPVLTKALEQGSWVILMYHAVGIPDGWGYYSYDEYVRDLDQIAAGDFWSANLGKAAAYAQERLALTVDLEAIPQQEGAYSLCFDDGLPDSVFDQPLSVTMRFAATRPDSVRIREPVGSGQATAVRGDSVCIQLLPQEEPVVMVLD